METARAIIAVQHFPGRFDHQRAHFTRVRVAATERHGIGRVGGKKCLLPLNTVQTVVDDTVKHRFVDHDLVARIHTALVHQRAALEWLDKLIKHIRDFAHLLEQTPASQAFADLGNTGWGLPGCRRLALGQEDLIALFPAFPNGRAIVLTNLDSRIWLAIGQGRPVQCDERLPGHIIEIALQAGQGKRRGRRNIEGDLRGQRGGCIGHRDQ